MRNRIIQSVVFTAAVALAVPVAAEERNDEPRPETLAIIKVLHGTVTATTGQGTADAKLEQELVGTDRIEVKPEAWTVVRLRNGYYVRIDDEISIAVNQIALVDVDRKPDASDEDQLRRLLSPEEYSADWQQAKGERLAGWFVRRTVGEQQPVQSAVETKEAVASPGPGAGAGEAPRSEPKEQGAISKFFSNLFGGKKDAPAAPVTPRAEPEETVKNIQVATVQPTAQLQNKKEKAESPAGEPTGGRNDIEVNAATAGGKARMQPPKAAANEPAVATAPPLPDKKKREAEGDQPRELPAAWIAKLKQDAQLKACVKNSVAAMGLEREQVELRVKVVGGKVVKIALGNGLHLQECAATFDFKNLKPNKQYPVADGWHELPFAIKN